MDGNADVCCRLYSLFERYMVNEKLIEEFWPEMSKKIKEEADWAFLA